MALDKLEAAPDLAQPVSDHLRLDDDKAELLQAFLAPLHAAKDGSS